MLIPHESKRTLLRALAGVALVLLGLLSILGTGGGGGGGGSSVTPVTYTGVTTQATIDQNNAQLLTSAALQGGNAGTTVAPTGVVTEGTKASGEPRVIAIVDTLKGSLAHVDFTSASTNVAGVMVDCSTTVSGPYSGTLALSITCNSDTGEFSGTASFSNFCDSADSCVNGDSGISGQFNISVYPPELSSMQLNFTRLDVTDSGDAYAMTGNIGLYVISPTSVQVTESVVIGDASGTYKIDNYSYVLTDYAGYEDVHLTAGRFYHPMYGYVDALTPASLLYNVVGSIVANWPYQGTFQIAGASNTKALLTALSDSPLVNPQWQLQIDVDGNSTWDVTKSDIWSNL